ncbi:MAG: RHS repeat-associated core domain-containing protein [Thermodesulfovibrionales bacterium]|nr:RHS repeat-associated core domain-containing protein [Thermodesulfovibrionales bacterium]
MVLRYIPIPIRAKNDLELLPGEKAVLWYYDESPNEDEAPNDWAIAGTGTVTPDGMHIVSDPGVGIPKFCCGATTWGGTSSNTDSTGPDTCNGQAADPVDLATGYFIHEKTDLHIPGIIPVNIKRYYTSKDKNNNEPVGAFGRNTYFEYDWWLGAYDGSGNINNSNPTMYLLIKPGNYQYRFPKQPDGTFINTTDPSTRGDVVTKNADNSRALRTRDGWTYKFDSNGKLIEIADRNGNKLTLTRRSDFEGGYIQSITTAEGRTIIFNQSYTGNFHKTDSITDHTGRTLKYTYDTYNSYPRLLKAEYPDGGSIQYGHDSSGRMSEIINEKGIREVLNEYDSSNKVIKQTHIDGGIYTFSYTTAGGNITEGSMTFPNSATATWRFIDDSGAYRDKYVVKKTTPDGATTYDREAGTNLLKSVTDPLGRKMSYTYYTNGLTKTVTDNLGNVTSYEYESTYGLPTKITDALGKSTTITYTFSGSKVTKAVIKDPLLNTTTINYNTYGMPVSITDPNNNTTTLFYENTSKPSELTAITDPLGNTFSISYNNLGMQEKITDAKGKSTYYNYDVMGRISGVTDPLDGLTRYFYDLRGSLAMLIDPKNNMIRYEYDERDRITKMTDQLGREETYTYDTSDNLKTMTDRKGQTTTFNQYDLMNRLKKITYHDNSFTEYTYDAAGRVDYINDSVSGYIDYLYNDFGCTSCSGRGMDRIAKETTPLGTIDYTYDKLGRRLSMTVGGQNAVKYVYDASGRMTSISQKIGNSTKTYPLTYDNASRRTTLKIPTSSKNKYVTTTYGYDTANRLLSMLQQGPSAQIETLIYEYDENSNRTKFTRNTTQPLRDGVTEASYDNANEMLTFTPASSSAKNMTYDANGNMTSVTNSCGTTNYTWDVRNRMTGINGFKADCSVLTASFKYDAVGRRIEKTINGTTTKYLYDGMDIIQEKNQSGAATANYIRTLNIDEPLTRIKGSTIRHYVTDALGSVIGLTDDTGVLKTTYTYDPFGNVTVSGESSDNPFQYTGRENDGTGLYYYRARYYSPELQRFISEDPIRLVGGINLYAYVGNNPVNKIDPMGLAAANPIITNPTTNNWPPPLPGDWCETKCYLVLFNDILWCNIAWSANYLHDPRNAEPARQWNTDCKQTAYNKYNSCIDACKKEKCPPEKKYYWQQGY